MQEQWMLCCMQINIKPNNWKTMEDVSVQRYKYFLRWRAVNFYTEYLKEEVWRV